MTNNSSRSLMYVVVFMLCALGISMAAYKNFFLGLPIFPGERAQVWEIEAAVDFMAESREVKVSLALPESHQSFTQVDEFFVSPGYGFRKTVLGEVDRAVWTKQYAEGRQYLYYKIKLHDSGKRIIKSANVTMRENEEEAEFTNDLYLAELAGASRVAADDLLSDIGERSSDTVSFATLLIKTLNAADATQNVRMLMGTLRDGYTTSDLLMQLFSLVEIPARLVRGIYLEDGRRKQPLVNMIEVMTDEGWLVFDPGTGVSGIPANFFLWQRGGVSLMDVRGGHDSKVAFSIIARSVPASDLIIAENKQRHSPLIDFSLYSLPVEEQNAYKYILMVPIGTLIVVLMRILVGLRTSGTFMPVLISLAFLQTKLLPGLVIFLVIVSIGLWIRFILSRLNLLLVSRISAVVIVVIGIMALMSILSYKLDIRQALSVTFFPMVILAWTIERMSILWEEEGSKDVFITGGGSLLVATISYFAMTNRYIEHLTFNFPEVLLVVLGVTLLLGQYTGYRLLELRRFKPIILEK